MTNLLEEPDVASLDVLMNTPPADLTRPDIEKICALYRGLRARREEAIAKGEKAPRAPRKTSAPKPTADKSEVGDVDIDLGI
jgi:hypothetical protein